MMKKTLGLSLVIALGIAQFVPLYATDTAAAAQTDGASTEKETGGEFFVQPKKFYTIARLEDELIAQHHAKIIASTATNYKVRLSVKTVAGIAALYGVYHVLLKDRLNAAPPAAPANDLSDRDRLLKNEAEIVAIKKGLYALNPDMFSWQWFKNSGRSIVWGMVGMLATKNLADMTEKLIDNVFHDGTIAWFIKNQTHMLQDIKEFTEYANAAAAPLNVALKVNTDGTVAPAQSAASESSPEHTRNQLAFIAHNIVKNMNSVIAFMQFNVEKMAQSPLNTLGVTEGYNLINYSKVITNDFAASVEAALNNPTAKITPIMTKFAAELGKTMASFSRIEHENPIE